MPLTDKRDAKKKEQRRLEHVDSVLTNLIVTQIEEDTPISKYNDDVG